MAINAPVATRNLRRLDTNSKVVIELFEPVYADRVWQCPYRISGDGIDINACAFGEDSMQSIILCFEAIRKSIDELPYPLSWASGEGGDIGIPRAVPTFFGIKFQRKVEAAVEGMVEEQAKCLQREAKNTRRRRD